MNIRIRNIFLALATGCFLLSCADVRAYVPKENRRVSPSDYSKSMPISREVAQQDLSAGVTLDCSSFELSLPSKNENKPNEFILDGANLNIALSSPSFHGLSLGLDAPLDYNGAKKDINLTLRNESLHFSLTDSTSDYASGYGGIRYKTSIASSESHAGEEDELTRGKTYFEYGSLDYFLYSIFENFEIEPLSLFAEKEAEEAEEDEEDSEEGILIDWEAILDCFDHGVDMGDDTIKILLPIGNEEIPVGLYANEDNWLYAIDFPYGGGTYAFESGMKLGFSAKLFFDEATFDLPFDDSTYLELADSLELVNELGDLVRKKTFGVDANLSIKHIEDAVEADDTHFERATISEVGTLTASVDADLSSSFHNVTASAALYCAQGGTENLLVHVDDESDSPLCYFDFNGVLRGFSPVSTFSSLLSSVSGALKDETIQNQTILRLVAGLLATSDSLKEAIDAITGSGVYTNINEGHYESLVDAVSKIGHRNNAIYATLDLSHAKGSGLVNIVLDASSSSLASLEFIDAGIVTSNSPKLSLLLNGYVRMRGYVKQSINKSVYPEYRHLPSLCESLDTFTESDCLTVTVEGYLSKKGTSATTSYSVPSWNGTSTLSTQGFSFAGKLGFDLEAKTGTGSITFEDHKEKYFNDHNLKVDVTGDKVASDSDSKDYLGTEGASSNFLLVEYDSKNNNSVFANSANKSKGNRTNPENGSLKGRFSIHSLDGILDLVADLLTSTDPRFKRLTNLFSNVMDRSTLGTILSGHYMEAISNGFLQASSISDKSATFTFKPGLVKESYPLQLRVKFHDDYLDEEGVMKPGKIASLEILHSCPSSIADGSDLYAKIEFESATAMPAFNFNKANYTSFTPFSSLKLLMDYLLGTITLGVTDTSTVTTYYLSLTAKVKLLLSTKNITFSVYIFLDGTNVKIVAQVDVADIAILIENACRTTIFYETDGGDTAGDLYIHRAEKGSTKVQTKRVTGKNFMNNIASWIGYILNLGSSIRDALDGEDSSGGQQAIHGEDLIRSYGIESGSSMTAPVWKITASLAAIIPSGIKKYLTFQDLPLTISGKTVTYSSGGKNYSKKSLYSISGTQSIKISVIGIKLLEPTATINGSLVNISDGKYKAAWNNNSYKLTLNGIDKGWFSYSYTDITTATPSALFSGKYGKNSSNSTYNSTSYSAKP